MRRQELRYHGENHERQSGPTCGVVVQVLFDHKLTLQDAMGRVGRISSGSVGCFPPPAAIARQWGCEAMLVV